MLRSYLLLGYKLKHTPDSGRPEFRKVTLVHLVSSALILPSQVNHFHWKICTSSFFNRHWKAIFRTTPRFEMLPRANAFFKDNVE